MISLSVISNIVAVYFREDGRL